MRGEALEAEVIGVRERERERDGVARHPSVPQRHLDALPHLGRRRLVDEVHDVVLERCRRPRAARSGGQLTAEVVERGEEAAKEAVERPTRDHAQQRLAEEQACAKRALPAVRHHNDEELGRRSPRAAREAAEREQRQLVLQCYRRTIDAWVAIDQRCF